MDHKRLNPCEYERIVSLLAWAETDCWCCTSLRSGLVFGVLGVVAGLLLGGKFVAAMLTFIFAAPLVVAMLHVARIIWKDDSDSTGSQSDN
jgi:hypothetical protein